MPNRSDWPDWAVERSECANCGRYGYSETPAPPRLTVEFERWLTNIWPIGRCQHTRLGFFLWCSDRCEQAWKAHRAPALEYQDGWAHAHEIEMDRRRVKSGAM